MMGGAGLHSSGAANLLGFYAMQIVWSITAIASLFAIVFIITRG
jgi:hypothetical protein